MVVTLQPFFISFIKNNYSPPNVFSNFQTCELANLRSYEVQITQYPLTLCIHAPSQQQGASKLHRRKPPKTTPTHNVYFCRATQQFTTKASKHHTPKYSQHTQQTLNNHPHHPTINPTTTQNPTTKPLLISKIKKY